MAIARSQMDQIYPGRLHNAIKQGYVQVYLSWYTLDFECLCSKTYNLYFFYSLPTRFPRLSRSGTSRGFWDMLKAGTVRLSRAFYVRIRICVLGAGSGAKNLALLQNQWKTSQLGNLINLIKGKIIHKGKNYSLKLRKYSFCTTTQFHLNMCNISTMMTIISVQRITLQQFLQILPVCLNTLLQFSGCLSSILSEMFLTFNWSSFTDFQNITSLLLFEWLLNNHLSLLIFLETNDSRAKKTIRLLVESFEKPVLKPGKKDNFSLW